MDVLRGLKDRRRRRNAHFEDTPLDLYSVRVAHEVREYSDAFELLHLILVFQGHVPVDGSDLRITPQHVLPESTVLVAYEGEMLVGTITITKDSPIGVPLDRVYPYEIKDLRAKGRVVEFGSLAVVRRCWKSGVTHLLLIAAYRFAREFLGAEHCVIGVSPGHVPFYRALYDFEQLAEVRSYFETDIPVAGMSCDMTTLPRFMLRHFKGPLASGKTMGEHLQGAPMGCIELPQVQTEAELGRWKMSRAVFRELFIEQHNRIDSLDPATLRYLEGRRSRLTLLGTTAVSDEGEDF